MLFAICFDEEPEYFEAQRSVGWWNAIYELDLGSRMLSRHSGVLVDVLLSQWPQECEKGKRGS